jgi:hypothetical protein
MGGPWGTQYEPLPYDHRRDHRFTVTTRRLMGNYWHAGKVAGGVGNPEFGLADPYGPNRSLSCRDRGQLQLRFGTASRSTNLSLDIAARAAGLEVP